MRHKTDRAYANDSDPVRLADADGITPVPESVREGKDVIARRPQADVAISGFELAAVAGAPSQ